MLRLPPFRLLRPGTLAEAARMLADEGAAAQQEPPGPAAAGLAGTEGAAPPVRLVAGGTDLWPNMKRRHQQAATVVSLMGIPELAGVRNGGGDAAGTAAELTTAAGASAG